ncbi:hypothetical protein PAPYR_9936 [Paratrimastix pyriformis]|uniref:Uncharacterized protein n=1 Tax=Paratrimastix pyriformis TaxID=342808 RepID=A0ABQ8U709_9EUKA|nr:hypothetical protein PAPYR_9936 [Paratrimastix pyriformis]
MWQANLTEWYEENPEGDLKKEENRRRGQPQGKPRRRGQPQERKPRRRGQPQGSAGRHRLGGGHRWAPSAGWGRTRRRKTQGDNLKKKKEKTPLKGTTSWEGAEENPGFGENLDGRMEDHAGDGNASQAGDIGGILLWLRWLGLASLLYVLWDREVWKGRLARISWMRVIMYAWGTWKV